MQSEKDTLIERYASDAFKNRNNPDLPLGVWRQHFVEFADKLAALSAVDPVAAMTTDYLGCEYVSMDVAGIEKIAETHSKGPTEVVYLYAAPPAPSVAVKALVDHNRKMIPRWKEIAEDGPEGNEPLGAVIRALEKATDALSAQAQDVAGWQLVPKEPTPEMVVAAKSTTSAVLTKSHATEIYSAMLAAAPAKQEG